MRIPSLSRRLQTRFLWPALLGGTQALARLGRRNLVHTPARLSLADRIKDWLDPAAMVPSNSERIEFDDPQQYETEIVQACDFARAGKIEHACSFLIKYLPLSSALGAIVDRVMLVVPGDREFAARQVALALVDGGQQALAMHILAESVQDAEAAKKEVLTVSKLTLAENSVQFIDAMAHSSCGHHFPQLLGYSNVSEWFKIRTLACVTRDNNFIKLVNRYGPTLLASAKSVDEFLRVATDRKALDAIVQRLIFHNPDENQKLTFLMAALDNATSGASFQYLYRPFKKHKDLGVNVLTCMLRNAIRLGLSYEMATICKMSHSLSVNIDPSLIARAVLATAFDHRLDSTQTRADIDQRQVINSPTQTQTKRIWDSVPPNLVEPVLASASTRLLNLAKSSESRSVSGRVLWTMLLTIPATAQFGPRTEGVLAKLLVQRPHMEQMRYMALPQVRVSGVSRLVDANLRRLMLGRRIKHASQGDLENEDDIRLIIAGVILASEKAVASKPQEGEFVRLVRRIFVTWNEREVAELLGSVHTRFAPLPNVIFMVLGMLVRHGAYTMAIQILHTVGAQSIPEPALWKFLLSLTRGFPEVAVHLVTWLNDAAGLKAPAPILRQMARITCRSAQLSESQITNRVHRLKLLLQKYHNTTLGVAATAEFIDALMRASLARGGGSRDRLYWAFKLAKQEHVPETYFRNWSQKLTAMRARHEGYFDHRMRRSA